MNRTSLSATQSNMGKATGVITTHFFKLDKNGGRGQFKVNARPAVILLLLFGISYSNYLRWADEVEATT